MVKKTRHDGLRSPDMSAGDNSIEDYVLGIARKNKSA